MAFPQLFNQPAKITPQNFFGMPNIALQQQAPVNAPPPQLPQITAGPSNPSPFGQIGDTLNQYAVNQQQKLDQQNFAQKILAMRFQPTPDDELQAYNQNTAALYTPTVKGTSPAEVANNRVNADLRPYTEIAKLQNSSAEANGGTIGVLANRLMAEAAAQGKPISFTQALYTAQTGMRQGTGLDASGNVMALPGAIPAKADLARATAQGRTAGANSATAQNDLPGVIATSNQSLSDIDALMNDPGLDAVSGLRGMLPPIPGSPGAATLARLKQVAGQTFLTAYNQLRGGGSITEVEGAKATAAKSRLDQAQSKEDIQSALTELKSVIRTGVQVAQLRAGGNPGSAPSNLGVIPSVASGKTVSIQRVQSLAQQQGIPVDQAIQNLKNSGINVQ